MSIAKHSHLEPKKGAGGFMLPLLEADDLPQAGGKARGLSRLLRAGFAVPEGVVLKLDNDGALPAELLSYCGQRFGDAANRELAVRSSAEVEDGAERSFAGQFESVLHLRDLEAVRAAIQHCSFATQRAEHYRQQHGEKSQHVAAQDAIAVIVQRMVKARAAGVLFTADPLTGTAERWVLEATAGTSEALLGGHARAQRYVLSQAGEILEAPHPEDRVLDDKTLKKLCDDARRAQQALGLGPALDLEWAHDSDGTLYWLQARAITVIDHEEQTAIDSPPPDSSWILTTYNVSEVVPGAVTPLSRTLLLHGIDSAHRALCQSVGVPLQRLEKLPVTLCYHGHLFLNLAPLYILTEYVLGTSKSDLEYMLAGRPLSEGQIHAAPVWTRARNLISYVRTMAKIPADFATFAKTHVVPTLPTHCDSFAQARAIYAALDKGWLSANDALQMHISVSTLSSAAYGVLTGVISNGRRPLLPEDHARASTLLRNLADDGDSSLAMGKAMEQLGRRIAVEDPDRAFQKMSATDSLRWLRHEAPPPLRDAFEHFLSQFGHRGIKEADIHEKVWSEDPLPLAVSLQALAAAPIKREADANEDQRTLAALSPISRRIVKAILPWVRRCVINRERTKSLAIRTMRALKPGFSALAEHFVRQGRLPESDLIFFLTHREIEELIASPSASLVRKAIRRRRAHHFQNQLRFPEINHGYPQPLFSSSDATRTDDEVVGTPVSPGTAMGKARVATTLAEGLKLEAGEILIVPHTDVGWTPLFARAAGLCTEIGGTLSHGSVVARELGLPAVVNLPGITRWLRTGDTIVLDGRTGVVKRLARK